MTEMSGTGYLVQQLPMVEQYPDSAELINMSTKQLYERERLWVDAGAAYLDVAHPGWADVIDVYTLDMGSLSHCILAQLEAQVLLWAGDTLNPTLAGYRRYLNKHGLSMEWTFTHGFDVDGMVWGYDDEGYELLNRLWKEKVRERREHANSVD